MKAIVTELAPNTVKVTVKGSLDEHAAAPLTELRASLRKERLVFDLGGIEHINSIGLVSWMTFLASIPATTAYTIERCPSVLVDAAQMLPGIFARATVESLYVRYYCAACRREWDALQDLKPLIAARRLPSLPCVHCKKPSASTLPWEDYESVLSQT